MIPEIARVLTYHGYRTFQPWKHGGARIFDRSYQRRDEIDQIQERLASQVGIYNDNHHGWLVEGHDGSRMFFRFSDWTLTVWKMPDGFDASPTLADGGAS